MCLSMGGRIKRGSQANALSKCTSDKLPSLILLWYATAEKKIKIIERFFYQLKA